MADDTEVKQDIEEAKIEKNASLQIVDGKVSANFSRYTQPDGEGECGKWISYPKIFDTMDEFSIYATKFFELEN